MLALQITAAILLVFSAACFFGPQLVIYGPSAMPAIWRKREAKFIGGFLVTASVFALTAPYFGSAMLSGGETITMVARDLLAMSFGVV